MFFEACREACRLILWNGLAEQQTIVNIRNYDDAIAAKFLYLIGRTMFLPERDRGGVSFDDGSTSPSRRGIALGEVLGAESG